MVQAVNCIMFTRSYSSFCLVWSMYMILMLQNGLKHSLVECNPENNITQFFENQMQEKYVLFNISNATEPDEIDKIENEFNLLNKKDKLEIAEKWVQIKNDLNRTFNFSYLNAKLNTSESSNHSISADVQIKLQKEVDNKEFLKRLNQSQRLIGHYYFNQTVGEYASKQFNFSNNETYVDKANTNETTINSDYELKLNSTENDLEDLDESTSNESNPKVFKEKDASENVNINDSFESIELETSSSELSNDIDNKETTNSNDTLNANKTNVLDFDSFTATISTEDANLTTSPSVIETSSISVSQNSTTTSNPDSISENPQFLECITSCGTDHECVRTKCLLDSTYFG